MNTLDLPSILEKYNNQLLDSLKNEFMNSFKEDLLNNIKSEIYNLFINNKEKSVNICGFKRTRHRGYCKRHVKGLVCPYHLKLLKNNSNISVLPDKKPDKKICKTLISTTINEDIDIKNKTFSGFLKNVENINDEIILLSNIEMVPTNNCNIYNDDINKIDKYENNGYGKLKLIEYNIIDSKIESENKFLLSEQKKKNKKKQMGENKNSFVDKINKNIKVEFVKDTKGKSYARNPFPDGFIIEGKYRCKCYIPVEYNGIDKIKIFLVNPKDNKDSKINIIEISDLEDLMLEIYTKETVDRYFNR